jgi:hypothetical protein
MSISTSPPVSHNGHGRGYSVADLRDLVLSMSTERETWAERERQAYRRGLAEGLDRGRTEGWLGCMATVKRTDAELVTTFKRLPRGDYRPVRGRPQWPGTEQDTPAGRRAAAAAMARVRASWGLT